jgi:uncharacterized membrane protein
MENQIIVLLWILIGICYTGTGYLITLKLISDKGRPSRMTRLISIILWPFMGLLAVIAPESTKH